MAGLISQADPNKTEMTSTLDSGNQEKQMKADQVQKATPLVSTANAQPQITTQSDNINVNTQDGGSNTVGTAVQPSETTAPMTTEEQTKETMKGVDAVIGSDSPLMERAALEGQRQASRRGLGNSSFGARAAQSAVYDAAIPLATQAADLASRERMMERQAEIDRLTQERDQAWRSGESELARELEKELANQNEQLQRDMEKSRQEWQSGESELGRELEREIEKGRQEWQSGESQLDREQQERIADKEADLRKLLQEDAQNFDKEMAEINKEHQQLLESSRLASSLMEGHYNRLAQVYANPDLSPEQQDKAMKDLNTGLNNSLAALQGMMNADIQKFLPGLGLPTLEDQKNGTVPAQPAPKTVPAQPVNQSGSYGGGSYGGGSYRRYQK